MNDLSAADGMKDIKYRRKERRVNRRKRTNECTLFAAERKFSILVARCCCFRSSWNLRPGGPYSDSVISLMLLYGHYTRLNYGIVDGA